MSVVYCIHCGQALDVDPAAAAIAGIACPKCGGVVQAAMRIRTTPAIKGRRQRSSSSATWLVIGGAVLIVVAVVASVLLVDEFRYRRSRHELDKATKQIDKAFDDILRDAPEAP